MKLAPPPAGPSAADRATLYLTHAVFMSLAFALLMPSAMAFPLFLRQRLPNGRWLTYHKYTQYTALAMCVIGLILAILAVGQVGGSHFSSLHKAMGLVTILLSFSQVGLALVRPHAPQKADEPKEPLRRAWEILHKGTAALIPILAVVQLVSGVDASRALGVELGGSSYGIFILFAALSGLVWGASFYVKRKGQSGLKMKTSPDAAEKAVSA